MKVYGKKPKIGYVASMLTPRLAERKCYSNNICCSLVVRSVPPRGT